MTARSAWPIRQWVATLGLALGAFGACSERGGASSPELPIDSEASFSPDTTNEVAAPEPDVTDVGAIDVEYTHVDARPGEDETTSHNEPDAAPADVQTVDVSDAEDTVAQVEDSAAVPDTASSVSDVDELAEVLSDAGPTGCATAEDCLDDGDACTAATCLPDGTCDHVALPCPSEPAPGDGCRTYACDSQLGCIAAEVADCVPCDALLYGSETFADAFCASVDACRVGACEDAARRCAFEPLDCDDQDDCTSDGCMAPLGCQHTPIAGCGPPPPCADDGDCDDASACTSDECASDGSCLHATVDCDDGDACSVDVCAPSLGCLHGPIACDDDDACTSDSCNVADGCSYEPISCDDDDACTVTGCEPAVGCTTSALPCDDGDACSVDSCDAASGCDYEPAVCDDGDLRSVDVCHP